MTVHWALAAGIALVATPLAAQSEGIGQAIATGQVGERYDGYMGFAGAPSPQLRRQVNAVNLRRRNLYIGLSTQRNVTAELVGMTAGCQLLSKLPTGEAYMLADGVWRRHGAGEAIALPDYCR